jgi:hypothetical protein
MFLGLLECFLSVIVGFSKNDRKSYADLLLSRPLKATLTLVKQIHDRVNRSQSTSLLLYDAIWYLVCPARFERATYALEAVKMRLNNSRNNGFKVLAFGVQ